jgi:DNA-binding beta-propeller fold protein YncE
MQRKIHEMSTIYLLSGLRSGIRILALFFMAVCLQTCMKNPEKASLTASITLSSSTEVKVLTTITSDGGSTIFQKGLCWSTHSNPTISDPHTNDGTGNGSFETSITEYETIKYFIRSYAVNGAGIGYGSELSYFFDNEYNTDNVIPVVQWINLRDDSIFAPGATINMLFSAYDSDGTITKVEVYANNTLLGTLVDNYLFSWENVQPGEYTIYAKAYDNGGAVGYSETKKIKVIEGATSGMGIISDLVKSESDELVFGLNQSSNKLLLINPENKSLSDVELPFSQPISMDYSFKDKKLYIVYKFSGTISVWDATNKTLSTMDFSESSDASLIKVDSENRRIYVAATTGLFILDMDTGAVLFRDGEMAGRLMDIDPNKKILFTSFEGSTPSILFKYSVEGDSLTFLQSNLNAGSNAYQIVINPNMDYLVLPCGGGNGQGYTLFAFDTDNLNNILGEFNIGTYPKSATFTPDGKKLIGTNGDYYDSYIYVMDAYSFVQIKKIFLPNSSDYSRVVTNYSGTKIVAFTYDNYQNDEYALYFFDLN